MQTNKLTFYNALQKINVLITARRWICKTMHRVAFKTYSFKDYQGHNLALMTDNSILIKLF